MTIIIRYDDDIIIMIVSNTINNIIKKVNNLVGCHRGRGRREVCLAGLLEQNCTWMHPFTPFHLCNNNMY